MKTFFKYGLEPWQLLPVNYRQWSGLGGVLSKATMTSFPLDFTFYELLRDGIGIPRIIAETFQQIELGQEVTTDPNWSAGPGDDYLDGRNDYKVVLHKGGKAVLIRDLGTGFNSDLIYDAPNSPAVPSNQGYIIGFKFNYQTYEDTFGLDEMTFDIRDTLGTAIIRIEIENGPPGANNGRITVYNNTIRTHTLIYLDKQMDFFIEIELTSATQFRVRCDMSVLKDVPYGGEWKGPYTNYNATTWSNPFGSLRVFSDVNGNQFNFLLWNIYFSWQGTEKQGWDRYNPHIRFMDIVCTKDSVVASDLDLGRDFDLVEKVFMGRLVQMTQFENNAILQVERYNAAFSREPILEENNKIDEEYQIDAFVDVDEIDCIISGGGTPTWVNDEHNLRGLRIINGIITQVRAVLAANPSGTYSGFGSLVIANYAFSQSDSEPQQTNSVPTQSTTASEFWLDYVVPIDRYPDREFKLYIKLNFSGWLGIGFLTQVKAPWIKLYESDGTTLSSIIKTWNTDNEHGRGTFDNANILEIEITEENWETYYDADNEQLKFQIYSGVYDTGQSPANKYNSFVGVYWLYVDYRNGITHDPIEVKILDTTAPDNLLLNFVSGEYDLKTNFINRSDILQILYNSKEWIENFLINYVIDIFSLEVDYRSSIPSYQLMKDKSVHLNLNEIVDNEAWEYFMTRTTYWRKPKIVFFDKDKPPNRGIDIFQNDIKSSITYVLNFLDQFRQVRARNKTDLGTFPAFTTLSPYPVGVVNRKDLPTAYLQDVAQSKFSQRDEIEPDLEIDIWKHQTKAEPGFDFEGLEINSEIFDNWRWLILNEFDYVDGTVDSKVVSKGGSQQVKLKKNDVLSELRLRFDCIDSPEIIGSQGYIISFDATVDAAGTGTDRYTEIRMIQSLGSTGHPYRDLVLQENEKMLAIRILHDGTNKIQYLNDSDVWTDTGLTITLTTKHTIDMELTTATTFRIRIDAGSWQGPFNQRFAWRSCMDYIEFYMPTGCAAMEIWFDNIAIDWGSVIEYAALDSPACKLHEGALVYLNLIPSLKKPDSVDYSVVDRMVIREMVWNEDSSLKLRLGFAEDIRRSENELLLDSILRRQYEVSDM
jgi:hypothetical protein